MARLKHNSHIKSRDDHTIAEIGRGRRPSFANPAPPELARPQYDIFTQELTRLGVPAQTGEFGAVMQVDIYNDDLVTIGIDSDAPGKKTIPS